MPSFKQSISKVLRPRSNSESSSPAHKLEFERRSLSSDCSTLVDLELPVKQSTYGTHPILEAEMIDPEDQAWGSPPPIFPSLKFPSFFRSRKRPSRA